MIRARVTVTLKTGVLDPQGKAIEHALESLASAARLTLHVKATGRDEHHIAEAAYKALGRALKAAVRKDGEGLPSTKGVL